MHKKLIPTKKTQSTVNIGISVGRGNLPLLSLLNKTNNKIKVHQQTKFTSKNHCLFF